MSIKLNNVTLAYEQRPAVLNLTVNINRGDWLAIVGPNGAGKSTLLNAMAGLSALQEGSIEGLCATNVAYLPQQTHLDKSFPLTVFELVATGLWAQLGFSRALNDAQRVGCMKAMAAVGLQGLENRMINTLSGGQLQRTLFARILLEDKPVILLDEPFNAIDVKTLSDLTKLLKIWHREKRTVIMVTHDLAYVREHCPRTLLLAKKCVGYGNTAEVLKPNNLRGARHSAEAFEHNASWCTDSAV